jgi:hypothetical protein
LQDVEFTLLERRRDGVVPVKYRGGYVIVDNGYLNWSATVPPFKVTNLHTEIRWSKWVESMRKDVECAFGILKGRWRVLKTGVRVQGVQAVDKVWLTCCALHNWLLDIDGLDSEWEGQSIPAPSDWEGEMGDVDIEGLSPNVLQLATNSSFVPRNYDSSGMGHGDDVVRGTEVRNSDVLLENMMEEDEDENKMDTGDGEVRNVRDLSLSFFRSRLVEHFDILFKRNEIKWTKRRGRQPRLN